MSSLFETSDKPT